MIADIFSVVATCVLGLVVEGVRRLLRDARTHARNHADILDVLESLADEQSDEKWRLHRVERGLGIAEPPPRADTRVLIDKIKARTG